MGHALSGLGAVLGPVYAGIRSKAFPINTTLLQQNRLVEYQRGQQYPGKLVFDVKTTAPAPCHCGNCPTNRDFNRDVYIVKQTALCWLDEMVDRVRECGRAWLSSGQRIVEVDGLALAEQRAKTSKYPPPVSNGLPVRLLPNGDYLWAPDVDPNQFTNCTVNGTA